MNTKIGPFNLAATVRLRETITKDGVPWSGIDAATFLFRKPDGTIVSRTGVLEDDTQGIWYYDTLTTDFDVVGEWYMTVAVVDGSVSIRYPWKITFNVVSNP